MCYLLREAGWPSAAVKLLIAFSSVELGWNVPHPKLAWNLGPIKASRYSEVNTSASVDKSASWLGCTARLSAPTSRSRDCELTRYASCALSVREHCQYKRFD